MRYPGGKSGAGVFQRIISLMPPHDTYVEPFLGGGAIMRLKRPAQMNIGLDLDPLSPGLEWMFGQHVHSVLSPFEHKWRFIRGCDGISFLESFLEKTEFSPTALVYCDPPYMMEARSKRRIYEHEMNAGDHRRLLRAAIALPCRVMISGYWTKLYARELKGWSSIHYEVMTRGGRTATEWLWFNFKPPVELHDYRYLGENFRERERIRRKQRRWANRLAGMDRLERQALLSAIADAGLMMGSMLTDTTSQFKLGEEGARER